MPMSMTGFAEAEGVYGGFRIVWQLRSVNHRFLDLSFRQTDDWPGPWHDLEMQVGKRLHALFSRGHLDCKLRLVAEPSAGQRLELDSELLEAVLQLEKETRNQSGAVSRGRLTMDRLLAWPGLIREYKPQPSENDKQAFLQATLALLDEAALGLAKCRAVEGEALAGVVGPLLDNFSGLLDQVEARLPALRTEQTRRLQERVTELASAVVEQDALARELAILLNRADISEEMARLRMHLKELRLALSGSEPLGKRLDFFCQELNRETNTLTAKSQAGEITQLGVEMKLIVEKLREQAQNLE